MFRMFLIIFFGFLSLSMDFVVDCSSLNDDILLYRHFEKSFGKHVMNKLFNSPKDLREAAMRTMNSKNETMESFVCTVYKNSLNLAHDLRRFFGLSNVQPIYASQDTEETTCFLVRHFNHQFLQLSNIQTQSLLTISPIPMEMKLAPHMISLLNWIAGDSHQIMDNIDQPLWNRFLKSKTMLCINYKPPLHHKHISQKDPFLKHLHDIIASTSSIDKILQIASTSKTPLATQSETFMSWNHWDRASYLHTTSNHVNKSNDNNNVNKSSDNNNNIKNMKNNQMSTAIHCNFHTLNLIQYSSNSIYISNLMDFVTDNSQSSYICTVLLLSILIDECNVAYVHLKSHMQIQNDYVADVVESGFPLHGRVFSDYGLDGTGIVIGVADTGVDENSCFFQNFDKTNVKRSTYKNPFSDLSRRKIVQYVNYSDDFEDPQGHGTHVCATIAGNSMLANTQYNGIAFNAKIAFFDIAKNGDEYSLRIPDLKNILFPTAVSAGATLHSNSWGGKSDVYDQDCAAVDRFLVSNPKFLAMFSAGNHGPGSRTLLSPAISKNALCVGSTGSGRISSITTLPSFSSVGPTPDGRFGVDILAPGDTVNSASALAMGTGAYSCQVIAKSGTSVSTAAVAGAAALVSQYFQDPSFWKSNCRLEYTFCGSSFLPTGSLIKTVLIHSGQDIGGGYPFPGPQQGFGRVDLHQVLLLDGVTSGFDLFVEDVTLVSFSTVEYLVCILDVTQPLKVTISWMDPTNPVPQGAARELMNDIDLVVKAPSDVQYLGNGGTVKDSLNNVEMVNISSLVSGNYTVSIRAQALFSVPSTQLVSIVITSGGIVQYQPFSPTAAPASPTLLPTAEPTVPSTSPSVMPSSPTAFPSSSPTTPSSRPTSAPSFPSLSPHVPPSTVPSLTPSKRPTRKPISTIPTTSPGFSWSPTASPATPAPTFRPSTAAPNILQQSAVAKAATLVPFVNDFYFFIIASGVAFLFLLCICMCTFRCCCSKAAPKKSVSSPHTQGAAENETINEDKSVGSSPYTTQENGVVCSTDSFTDRMTMGSMSDAEKYTIDQLFSSDETVNTDSLYSVYTRPAVGASQHSMVDSNRQIHLAELYANDEGSFTDHQYTSKKGPNLSNNGEKLKQADLYGNVKGEVLPKQNGHKRIGKSSVLVGIKKDLNLSKEEEMLFELYGAKKEERLFQI